MRTTSRGFGIHYTADGDGPPLMLVAGTMMSARHWVDPGYVAALAGQWRVINVDPLGHGGSDLPHDADAYTAAGVTADLIAVLDAEGVQRATVWGYSRGGWLACNLASRHPERVDRIVVGGFAMHAHRDEVDRMLIPMADFLRRGDWAGVWKKFGISDKAFQQMMEEGNDPVAVAAAIDGSMHPTRFVDPASITCPAFYYVGSEDWIVPHVRADVHAVGATLDVITGQAHLGAHFDAAKSVLAAVVPRL
ncbi:alpha/beta fold hydrolase [Mycolicibacterium sp. CR10]|uniref:alpha/beta fold hydrolase n=1 Tax=Mycolicibacterium sp. CR10 TaxID=2562314 RepID=UPI0010BF7C59|nr:alpha/beta hydrolase [Mycolicibacterium sp. CR10]